MAETTNFVRLERPPNKFLAKPNHIVMRWCGSAKDCTAVVKESASAMKQCLMPFENAENFAKPYTTAGKIRRELFFNDFAPITTSTFSPPCLCFLTLSRNL